MKTTLRLIVGVLVIAGARTGELSVAPQPLSHTNPLADARGSWETSTMASVTQVEVMGRVLSQAADRMNAAVAREIARLGAEPDSRAARFALGRAAALRRQIDGIASRAKATVAPMAGTLSEQSVRQGQAQALRNLREMGVRVAGNGPDASAGIEQDFTVINERAVTLAAQDITARLNQSVDAYAINARAVFRSLSAGPLSGPVREARVSEIVAQGIISGDPRTAIREMRRAIGDNIGFAELDRYRKLGNQLIEVGSATLNVRTYAEMVTRTRTREATVEASIDTQVEAGFDLGQITGANSANFCTRFLGLVVVLSGPARDGYPSIDELPDGPPPFHPNCSKSVAPYDAELSSAARTRAHERRLASFRRDQAAGRLTEDLRARRGAA
jgi:hypothetical protein